MTDSAIKGPVLGGFSILVFAILMFIIFLLTWGIGQDAEMEKSARQEVKTLSGYRFLLEREPLKTMGDKRRADLEMATWDFPKYSNKNTPGVYSAFTTRVETRIEEYKGQLAMKVNYAGLKHRECLALTEVAKQLQQPYVISGGSCIEKNHKNTVEIYFPELNGAE